MKNSVGKIKDDTVIVYFLGRLDSGTLLRHTQIREHDAGTLTLNGMIQTSSNYRTTDDDAHAPLLSNANLK
jgi:hypothetical protein